MAGGNAGALFATNRWCVVGNLDRNPIVQRLVAKLQGAGKSVTVCNPSSGPIKSILNVPTPPETVNLCVNPVTGLKLLQELVSSNGREPTIGVFIQPGASSLEILALCEEHSLTVHEGCVLVEMPSPS